MIRSYTYSEVGGHAANEDAFAAQPHPADPACWLVCVADGQGGQRGGGHAARVACRAVIEAAAARPADALCSLEVWGAVLADADTAVSDDPEAGFTTLIGLCVRGDRVAGASSGDSAAFAVTGGRSWDLTARQVKNPPVGSGAAVVVPFGRRLGRPWAVLVMTDGVWKYVGRERVGETAVRIRGDELMSELQRAARLPGSGQFPDDFTAVLLERDADSP